MLRKLFCRDKSSVSIVLAASVKAKAWGGGNVRKLAIFSIADPSLCQANSAAVLQLSAESVLEATDVGIVCGDAVGIDLEAFVGSLALSTPTLEVLSCPVAVQGVFVSDVDHGEVDMAWPHGGKRVKCLARCDILDDVRGSLKGIVITRIGVDGETFDAGQLALFELVRPSGVAMGGPSQTKRREAQQGNSGLQKHGLKYLVASNKRFGSYRLSEPGAVTSDVEHGRKPVSYGHGEVGILITGPIRALYPWQMMEIISQIPRMILPSSQMTFEHL